MPVGSHLAHDDELSALERLYLRIAGPPDPALRRRTSHVLRALGRMRPARVLDAACGAGFTTLSLARRLPTTAFYGIDIDRNQVARAQRLAEAAEIRNVEFSVADASSFDPPVAVDAVVCVDALEYFAHDDAFMRHARTVVRDGGSAVLHCRRVPTPRFLTSFRRADACYDGRLRAGYALADIQRLFENANFALVSIRETLNAPAEIAHELLDPELGPLRHRALRAAVAPALNALATLDAVELGSGAGYLAVGRAS